RWEARICSRCFAEPFPGIRPYAVGRTTKPSARFNLSIGFRVKLESVRAHAPKRRPGRSGHSLSLASRIAHPSKEASNGIVHGEVVEIIRLEPVVAEHREVRVREDA